MERKEWTEETTDKKIEETLNREFPLPAQVERAKRAAFEEIRNRVKAAEEKLGDSGRILVRESGTEPVIRVMAEAAEKAECERHVQEIVDVIIKQGHQEA